MKTYIITIFIFVLSLSSSRAQNNSQENHGGDKPLSGMVYGLPGKIPLTGAEIEIIPEGEKTITTETGRYELTMPGKVSWIRVSYPGYAAKEILAGNSGELDIYLQQLSEKSLDKHIPGLFGNNLRYKNSSYSYVSSGDLNFSAEINPETSVQGRIAGLNVSHISGTPGEGGVVNIRGISSLFANSQPLAILDGVPINTALYESKLVEGTITNPLSAIDINDIERIDFYPDGGSLYGMQGGAGLLVINTKKPINARTKVDFSAYTGLTFKPEEIKLLSGIEHKAYLLNLLQESGLSTTEIQQQNPWISGNPSYYYYYNYNNNTNWQEEVFAPAISNKYNAVLQGGDEIASFFVSLGYLNQEGVVKNTDYQRYNLRLNSKLMILPKLSMIANIGFTYDLANNMPTGINSSLNPITASLLKSPMLAPYLRDNNGNRVAVLGDMDAYGFSNPVALIKNSESSADGSNLFTNAKMVYNLNKKLNIQTLINVSYNNINENSFIPDYGIADFENGAVQNYTTEGISKYYGIISETSLEFSDNVAYKHFFTAIGGVRVSSAKQEFLQGLVKNTPTDEFKSLSSVTSIENTLLGGNSKQVNRNDLFITGSYRFMDKYLLDAVLDMSGSSNIGVDADALDVLNGKWGFFPSLHAAWLLSSEPFLENNKRIDLLKLRVSISYSGNDFYSSNSKYAYVSRVYGTHAGITSTYIPNKSLKWETLEQFNAGMDLGIFNERLLFNIDLYQRNTKDLLTYKTVPQTAGFEHYWQNNGTLSTRGMDVALLVKIANGQKFNFNLGANLAYSKSELDIPQELIINIPGAQTALTSGEQPFNYYGLETLGVFSTAEQAQQAALKNSNGIEYQAGDIHFKDQDGNHIIDDNDRVALGNIFPDLTAGLHADISYKNISLFALFNVVYGNKIFNYTRSLIESGSGYGNQSIANYYSWKGEGDQTEIPRNSFNDPAGNSVFSDRWIEDGSYIKLKEVTLAYHFSKTKIYNDLTVYLTGANLFVLGNYLGYSPEFAFSGDPLLQGSDYAQVPVTPMAVFGVKIGF